MPAPQALHADSADAPTPVLCLKRGEDRRLAAGHLWVFSNEVDTERTPLTAFAPGAVAQLRSHRDAFLGYAYVNPHALICARILSREPSLPVSAELIERRLRAALALRERLGEARYCRWVFGESDLLPGLVLDRYGELVVGQIATAGMEALREEITAAVRRVVSPRGLFWKDDSAARELEQLPRFAAPAFGEIPEEVEVLQKYSSQHLGALVDFGNNISMCDDPVEVIKDRKSVV